MLSGNHAVEAAVGYPSEGCDPQPCKDYRLDDILWDATWEDRVRAEAQQISGRHFPHRIAGRKSWSPAFREHVYTQQRLKENRDMRRRSNMTDAAKVALIKKLGFGDMLK